MTSRMPTAALAILIIASQIYIIVSLPKEIPAPTVITAPVYEITATVTAYTNRECETNSDNGHTATMEQPKAGWTCAVSRDLMHWLGGRVYIEGLGVRRVNDLMNRRFTQRVDVFTGTVREARAFGAQSRQVVFLGR